MQLQENYSEWYGNAQIGAMFKLGGVEAKIYNESRFSDRVIIGHHCYMHGKIFCKDTANINIGNYVTVENNVRIQSLERITVGNYVIIAGNSVIIDNNTHSVFPDERVKHSLRVSPTGSGYPGLGNGWELSESKPVSIADVVWIGQNCAILKGVTVGEGSIVARHSVVTKDVPPYTIVAGNPAKVVKEIKKPAYMYFEV